MIQRSDRSAKTSPALQHDARQVIAQLVAFVDRLGPPSQQHDPFAMRALRNLAEERRIRADFSIDECRSELRVQTKALRAEQERVVALHDEVNKLREELTAQHEQTRKLQKQLDEISGSRRFVFMRTMLQPIDWCRTRGSNIDAFGGRWLTSRQVRCDRGWRRGAARGSTGDRNYSGHHD